MRVRRFLFLGVLLQSVMRNPLADAGIIGISSGAAFVQLFIISFFPALFFMTPLFAFMGGAFACFLVFALSWKSGLSPLKLILVGIAINAMFTGLTEAFISLGGSFNVSASSVIGSNLTMRTWNDVSTIATYGTVGLSGRLHYIDGVILLVLQDKTAKSIGFNVARARLHHCSSCGVISSYLGCSGGCYFFRRLTCTAYCASLSWL